MTAELRSILLGTAGLSAAAVMALLLTLAREIDASDTQLGAGVRLAAVAVLFQAAHFGEELAAGFYQRFPELLGLSPWSLRFFVGFNLFWLAAWCLGIWGLKAGHRAALFPLWFLSIGCVANGLAHPLFAARSGGYFPGLVTSPMVGILGIVLFRRLLRITG
jgi:hypothetical protein